MNFIAGLYFVIVRFVNWPTLSEALAMERQGKRLLLFCIVIAAINVIEIGTGLKFIGWTIVMAAEFALGIFVGLIINKYYQIMT